jgi:hypothetical protein
MIDFIELNESQKIYVIEVMNRFSHDRDFITLAEMKEYHQKMVAARSSGCPKLGYPNWLIKPENKVSKSVYHLPVPTSEELEDFHLGNVEPQINLNKYSKMFQKVVADYGIL